MPNSPALASSLGSIRHQAKLMRDNLTEGHLMQAIKNCVNFLNELRSLAYSPKEYYELYMAASEALESFSTYLLQLHKLKQAKTKDVPFLTDLYELVQYSGNIVPRLYLMIAIGTTCMAAENAATKDIMKDMIEMCRGVQHPIRGLFLRHYLCQRTRDLFPLANMADFNDTVDFLVANFVEMNKLWVRLQHQGHLSERELRYQERKELKILVGSNLVRLSQVVDDFSAPGYSAAQYYESKLFPMITEQIIQCKDHLAQSYLIDVVIQIFPDEYHFATLSQLLNEVFLKLHPMLKKSEIIASLVERFVTYRKFEDDLVDKTAKISLESADSPDPVSLSKIFPAFWDFYANLRTQEPSLHPDELVPILQLLVKLLLAFDTSNVLSLDKIYLFAVEDLKSLGSSGNTEDDIQNAWKELLTTPVEHYASVKSLLELPFFYELFCKITNLNLQRQLACKIAQKLLDSSSASGGLLTTPEDIDVVFKYLQVLIETSGTHLTTAKDLGIEETIKIEGGEKLVSLDFLHLQETVSKVLHSIGHTEEFKFLSNLLYVKKKYLSKSPENIVYTYPTLVTIMTRVLRISGYRHLTRKHKEASDLIKLVISSNFKNISIVIDELYHRHQQFHAELALKLYLNLASVADQLRQESIAYELFHQCFVVYEENLVLASPQGQTINPQDSMGGSLSYQSIITIANRLASLRYFSKKSYEDLITKVTLYGSKLLKKQDQCRSIYFCAHLWWWCETLIDDKSPTVEDESIVAKSDGETNNADGTVCNDQSLTTNTQCDGTELRVSTSPALYRDAKRVLECLQKALRVADSCMDPYLLLKLFVEILNRCLIFNIYDNYMVDARYISGLIDLIRTNFANFEESHLSGVDDDQEAKLLSCLKHLFDRTIEYLRRHQESTDHFREISV